MAKLYVNANVKKGHINPELQGHFSEHLGRCIYEGIYVGEKSKIPNVNGMRKDVVEALKEIKVPVLRWPGGCFADEYHWKDGIGPKKNRKKMINTHWGGVVEDNSFGTHEFMELCRQLGCKTYINGNVGSGTVAEMSEWVEYMTFNGVSPMADLRKANGHEEPWTVDYFGVGNENWGCGGNMRPEYYGDLYRRYQTYIRNYDSKKPIAKIACGANAEDYHWTDKVMETIYDHSVVRPDGLSLHYYTLPTGNWSAKGSSTEFDEEGYYATLKRTLFMETLLNRHSAIMDQYDPEKKVNGEEYVDLDERQEVFIYTPYEVFLLPKSLVADFVDFVHNLLHVIGPKVTLSKRTLYKTTLQLGIRLTNTTESRIKSHVQLWSSRMDDG